MATTINLSIAQTTHVRQTFDALFLQYYQRAYRFAYRLLQHRGDAEDLTQEAFVRAWNGFAHYDPSRPFERWLFRIVYHLAIDFHWRRKRVQILSLDVPLHNEANGIHCFLDAPDVDADPARIVLDAVCSEEVQQAFNALPQPYLVTLLLVDVYQQTYAEAAGILGIGLGTVRSRIHRGRKMLRQQLAGSRAFAQKRNDAR